MSSFAIHTLGCKVNQYESQQIVELLGSLGLRPVERNGQAAELVVVNTCCVTHTASAKSRQCIRRAQRLNPGAVIVVVGCLAAVEGGGLSRPGSNIHVVGDKSRLPAVLARLSAQPHRRDPRLSDARGNSTIKAEISPAVKYKNAATHYPDLGPLSRFRGHTRAFLKVQDGCDGPCTYCIIPKTRPVVRSKRPEAVLAEARALVAAGHKEIVVTGIFLGAYGQETVRRNRWLGRENPHLPDLLEKLAQIAGLERIRLSSLEPMDVTPGLLDVLAANRNIMPHLHLSLQSGSNRILRLMCRQYRRQDFLAAVQAVRARLDRPAITTDIIVGFPGERDEDFQETVELVRQVGFSRLHVFGFSPRKGTAAARMGPPVAPPVTRHRCRLLRGLGEQLAGQFRRQFIGETASVLIENTNGKVAGRSERYFEVCLDGRTSGVKTNDIVSVELLEDCGTGLRGRALIAQRSCLGAGLAEK